MYFTYLHIGRIILLKGKKGEGARAWMPDRERGIDTLRTLRWSVIWIYCHVRIHLIHEKPICMLPVIQHTWGRREVYILCSLGELICGFEGLTSISDFHMYLSIKTWLMVYLSFYNPNGLCVPAIVHCIFEAGFPVLSVQMLIVLTVTVQSSAFL